MKSFSLKWEMQATARFKDPFRAMIHLGWHDLNAHK